MNLYRKAKILSLTPVKTLRGLLPISPKKRRSVIFPHQGLGDLIWALGIARYHQSKYDEVVLIANEAFRRDLNHLLNQHSWGKDVRLHLVSVNFKSGDREAANNLLKDFPNSDFYLLGWYDDSYPLFYPDWFYLDAHTPRSFMTSLFVSEIGPEFDEICTKYNLPLKKFSYSYVHLRSGTDDGNPTIFEKKFLNGNDTLTICPHHVFSSRSAEFKQISSYFHEVAKSLTLWENLILSTHASSTAILDSALFNLMAATKLWPRNLIVFKRDNYHHFWGPILKGPFKRCPIRKIK
jgi:hypothetical protein